MKIYLILHNNSLALGTTEYGDDPILGVQTI